MLKSLKILSLVVVTISSNWLEGYSQVEFNKVSQYSYTNQLEDLKTEIEKIIKFDTEIDYKKTPGFIVGIIDGDQQYVVSFGYKTTKKLERLSVNDIFEIGSLTKSMTADITIALIDQGLLSYDDKVNSYLPIEYQNPRLENVHVLDLLNHKSSLPKLPKGFGKKEKYFQNPFANYTKTDLLQYYRDFLPDDFDFKYSHINYALLELIIEHVTHESYEDVLETYLSESLQLENTFVDFKEQKMQVTTPGYDRSRKTVDPWTYASFKGSMGIKSSMGDLLKYTKYQLSKEKVLSPKDWSSTQIQAKTSFNEKLYQDLGWHFVKIGDQIVTINTGFTSGYTSFIARVDASQKAVIILSNSSIGVGDLGLQVLRMISNSNLKSN